MVLWCQQLTSKSNSDTGDSFCIYTSLYRNLHHINTKTPFKIRIVHHTSPQESADLNEMNHPHLTNQNQEFNEWCGLIVWGIFQTVYSQGTLLACHGTELVTKSFRDAVMITQVPMRYWKFTNAPSSLAPWLDASTLRLPWTTMAASDRGERLPLSKTLTLTCTSESRTSYTLIVRQVF